MGLRGASNNWTKAYFVNGVTVGTAAQRCESEGKTEGDKRRGRKSVLADLRQSKRNFFYFQVEDRFCPQLKRTKSCCCGCTWREAWWDN